MKKFTPERLLNKGRRINWLLHPLRNNPRHRYALYHGFISWVGAENWGRVRLEIKNSWESASNSFDKLLGLLKVYRFYTDPQELLTCETPKKQESVETPKKQESVSEVLDKCLRLVSTLHSYEETKPSVAEYECLLALLSAAVPDGTEGKAEITGFLAKLAEARGGSENNGEAKCSALENGN